MYALCLFLSSLSAIRLQPQRRTAEHMCKSAMANEPNVISDSCFKETTLWSYVLLYCILCHRQTRLSERVSERNTEKQNIEN